jgi:hypothetical protein
MQRLSQKNVSIITTTPERNPDARLEAILQRPGILSSSYTFAGAIRVFGDLKVPADGAQGAVACENFEVLVDM